MLVLKPNVLKRKLRRNKYGGEGNIGTDITYVVQQDTNFRYGWIFIHNMFDSSTCNTQFIDAPEDGPVGPKHVELSNILWINIHP